MPPGLSDLVLDTQIRVKFDSQVVYRFTFESARVSGKYVRRKERRQAWKEDRFLGDGSFGDVYLHQCSSSENETQLQAVKTIDKARMAKQKIDIYKEIEAIAKFSQQKYHGLPFVEFLGWYESEKSVFIAMEYIQYGDLHSCLTKSLPEEEARKIAYQVVDGLVFLHANSFVHRDIKPKNIFVVQMGPEWLVKIGDFGMSKRINENSSLRTIRGTQAFLAPEMQGILPLEDEEGSLNYHYTESVDMWALGVTIFYLLYHDYPFSLKQPSKLPRYIWGANFPFPKSPLQKFSPECYTFIEGVMARDAKKRLSSRKALDSEWLMECDSSPAPSRSPTPPLKSTIFKIQDPARKSSGQMSSSTETPASPSSSLAHKSVGGDIYETTTNPNLSRSRDFDSNAGMLTVTAAKPSISSPSEDVDSEISTVKDHVRSENVEEVQRQKIQVISQDLNISSLQESLPVISLISGSQEADTKQDVPRDEGDRSLSIDASITYDAQSSLGIPDADPDVSSDRSNNPFIPAHSENNSLPHGNLSLMHHEASQVDIFSPLSTPSAKLDDSAYSTNIRPNNTGGSECSMLPLFDSQVPQILSSTHQESISVDVISSTDNAPDSVHSLKRNKRLSSAEHFSSEYLSREILSGKEDNYETRAKLHDLQKEGIKMLKGNNYDEAERLLQQVLNARKQIFGAKHEATLDSYHTLGGLWYKKTQYSTALALFKFAAEGRKATIGPKHPDTLSSFYWLGGTQSELGLFKEAEVVLRRNAEDRASTIGFSNPKTLQTNHMLGVVLWAQWNWKEALSVFEIVVEERRVILGQMHPDTVSSMFWTGYTLYKLERYERALLFLKRAAAGQKLILGLSNNETIRTISVIGCSLYQIEKWEEARAVLQEAASLNQITKPKRTSLYILHLLGRSLFYLKRYEEASHVLQEAADGQKKLLGPTHPETLSSLYMLGRSFLDLNQFVEAEVTFQQAVNGGVETFGPEHPETLNSVCSLGFSQCKLKMFEQAKDILHWAVKGLLKTAGPSDMDTLRCIFWLSCSLYHLKLYDQVEATYREVLSWEIKVKGCASSGTLDNIDSLGWVYYCDEKYRQAEKLAGFLVGCRMETEGPMGLRTLEAKRLLALTLHEEGHMERALLLHGEVLQGRVEVLGAQHKDTLQSSWEFEKCQAGMSETEIKRVNKTLDRADKYYSTKSLREPPEEESQNEKRNWIDVWTRVKRSIGKPDETF